MPTVFFHWHRNLITDNDRVRMQGPEERRNMKKSKKILAALLSSLLLLPLFFSTGYADKAVKVTDEKLLPGIMRRGETDKPMTRVEPGKPNYPDITAVSEFMPLSEGEVTEISLPGNWQYAWYSFTAEKAGSYVFTSLVRDITPDTLVVAFDENKKEFAQSDDTDLSYDFQLIIGLEKNETCYFAVTARSESDGKMTFPVSFSEKPDFNILSLTAEDYTLYHSDSYEDDGVVYYDYPINAPDLVVTVKTADNTYLGNVYDVLEELYNDYGFVPGYYSDVIQDAQDPLKDGLNKNKGTIRIDQFEGFFNVLVRGPEVTRIYGKNRWSTATLIADRMKEALGLDKFNAIIIANGTGTKNDGKYQDALAGSYLSAAKQAPLLMTSTSDSRMNTVVSYVEKNLDPNGTVYILGGSSVVPASMEEKLKAKGFQNIVRLWGKDKFGTCESILKEVGVEKGAEVLLCSSKGFADSLSASSTGFPIMLISDTYKKRYSAEFLNSLKEKGVSFTIIGGEAAVTSVVEEGMKQYGKVERLAGDSRYSTSTAIAETYFYDPTDVILADGRDFPDGLCAGPLGYVLEAPVLLTRDKDAGVAQSYIADYAILHKGYVIGGTGCVSDNSVQTIFGSPVEKNITD